MTSFTNQEFEQLKEKYNRQPNSMLFARLADYYLNRNEVDKALDLSQKGIAFHTEYATGYFILAKCLLKLRRYEEAEKALKKVLLLDSKFLLAQKYHGDLLKDIGGWDNAAEASYRRILEIDPLDEDTRAMLEALKQKQKVVTEEEKHYPPIEDMEPQPMMPEKLTDEDLLTVTEAEAEAEEEPELSLEQISDRLDPDDDEARFSSILDDIFGEKLAMEERRVEDNRKIIERTVPVSRADVYVSRRTEETEETDMDSDLDYPEEADVEAPEIRPDLISPMEKPEPEEPPEEPEAIFSNIPDQTTPEPKMPPAAERDSKLGRKDRIVTPTLGEIYAAQGQYEKAINVFETLLEKQPDSQNYKDKIRYLKQKLAEQQDMI